MVPFCVGKAKRKPQLVPSLPLKIFIKKPQLVPSLSLKIFITSGVRPWRESWLHIKANYFLGSHSLSTPRMKLAL